MTRQTIYEKYIGATETLTNNVRKLDFAGIAVVWLVLVGDTGGVVQNSTGLKWPLLFFVISLACDLFQFIYRAAIFGILNDFHRRAGKALEDDVTFSGKWNYPTILFFWMKILLCGLGYILLALNVGNQLWQS